MNKQLLFGIPLLILVCSMVMIDFASAVVWTWENEELPALYNAGYKWNTEAQTVEHRSGVFVVVFFYELAPFATGAINVTQYSASGTKVASAVIVQARDAQGDDRTFFNIVDHNSTHCFIFVTDTDAGTTFYCQIFSWTVIGYTLTHEYEATIEVGNEINTPSQIASVYYQGDPYFIFYSIGETNGVKERIRAWYYDVSANQLLEAVDLAVNGNVGLDFTVQPFLIQDPDLPEIIYLMCSYEPDATLPKFWKIDLSSNTGEELAGGGAVDRLTIDWSQHYIDSGMYTDATDVYLYWTWAMPYITGTTRNVRIIQHRLRFNVTIETAQLEAQNERVAVISSTLPAGTEECWAVPTESNRTEFTVYTPLFTGGDYTGFYWDLEVDDWLNFGIASIVANDSGEDNDTIPFITEEDIIYRDGVSAFQLNIDHNPAPDEWNLFYGLSPVSADYDITLVYTPADDPLFTNTVYSFTITTFRNDIQTQLYIISYMNDHQHFAGQTNSAGVLQFSYETTSAGVHTVKINIYVDSDLKYSESFPLSFSQFEIEAGDPAGVLVTSSVYVMQQALPLMFLLLMPAVALGKIMGTQGIIFGVVIGLAMGVMTGYVPPYITFLIALSVVGYFVYRAR